MFSTREKNRRSNVDFPQLIALNVGDFILGCKFAAEQACPLNGGLKLERIEFLTEQGHKTEWKSDSDLGEKASDEICSMSKPVIEVQIRGLAATSGGCAVFLGNEDKVFVI